MEKITFEKTRAANATIKTTDIKGKEYAEVNQRIKAFRMVCPDGFIITEMLSNENGVCVFRASVGYYGENGEPRTVGTGTAYEKESSSYINKTSYIENCETSAVGRALGMAGFGIDTSVASAEEVQNAINNQTECAVESPVVCPVCGKEVKPIKANGKTYSPKEVIERRGMCPDCWRVQQIAEGKK